MNNYSTVLKKYAVFDGRARRTEFWMFTLINTIIIIALKVIQDATSGLIGSVFSILYVLYSLGIIVPIIAVNVRRLHDTNRSGWWILLSLIPVIGSITLLIFNIQDSTPGENRFGPNPKGVSVPPVVPTAAPLV